MLASATRTAPERWIPETQATQRVARRRRVAAEPGARRKAAERGARRTLAEPLARTLAEPLARRTRAEPRAEGPRARAEPDPAARPDLIRAPIGRIQFRPRSRMRRAPCSRLVQAHSSFASLVA